MRRPVVVITDHGFANLDPESRVLAAADLDLRAAQCKTAHEVIEAGRDADALLVQWAPITAEVVGALAQCKIIVRYGIGVDNVDLAACKARSLPVCNVPDYGIDEVADHAMAMALSLARQLAGIDHRLRQGVWKMAPVTVMPAFSEMTFVTAGFGRIARAVLERAKAFKFKMAACDLFVDEGEFARAGVARFSAEEAFRQADILSLHLPLTDETRHWVNAERLEQMRPNAIIINTARGMLIDTLALAKALREGCLAYAGLDVFESEPLPMDHPLRACGNALLTSHVAWFSASSGPRLQKLAAEEVVRGLRGEPLRNQVNR